MKIPVTIAKICIEQLVRENHNKFDLSIYRTDIYKYLIIRIMTFNFETGKSMGTINSLFSHLICSILITFTCWKSGSIWIGATDQIREKDWRSITTGKSVPYTNWSRGNPNNNRGIQHCATLNWGGRGRWDDNYCFRRLTFICEVSGTFKSSCNLKES